MACANIKKAGKDQKVVVVVAATVVVVVVVVAVVVFHTINSIQSALYGYYDIFSPCPSEAIFGIV